MKRLTILFASVCVLLIMSYSANAQDKFFQWGLKAGLDFTNMTSMEDLKQDGFLKSYTGFNAGLALKMNLPLGFELQPELLYVQSGFNVSSGSIGELTGDKIMSTIKSGSLRVPVNVQWGFRLFKVIKPYVMVSPYVGCALFQNGKFMGETLSSDNLHRLEYGIGAGAGINIWKIQVSFKWNWALNPIVKADDLKMDAVRENLESAKLNGGELSVAFLF